MTQTKRKAILLAGGTGSRLMPVTRAISKQLLPIYNKPMVYYPLTTLMLSDLRDIAIITTPEQQSSFANLIGDGAQWGLNIEYIAQPEPEGISQAYILAEAFLDGHPSCLILGDNLFFGADLPKQLSRANQGQTASVFATHVRNPEAYGVVEFRGERPIKIVEKPQEFISNYAVTGLYYLPSDAPDRARQLSKSARGEYEITDLLNGYIEDEALSVEKLGRGYAWLDTGTHAALLDAGNFVRTLEDRQGLQVGSPDEIALQKGWISTEDFEARIDLHGKSSYGAYLKSVVKN